MNKRILLCIDGTWSTTEEKATSVDTVNTNVLKMHRACIPSSSQIAIYDSGVGVYNHKLTNLTGGAFGAGIDEKIKQGYAQIATVFEPGDDLFLFGWSRGAYAIRCVATMIYLLGLPTKKPINNTMIDQLFLIYRNPEKRRELLAKCTQKYSLEKTVIKFVGVLDTVGSLGINAMTGGENQVRYGFLDTDLPPNVSNAFHAMAIDECRQQYPVTMWNFPYPLVKGQVLEQVWFAGCHDDVGGGFPENEAGLSEIPLKWMADKASNLGLQLDPALLTTKEIQGEKLALSPIHESWNKISGRKEFREIPFNSFISNSVAFRCEKMSDYRPQNLNFVDGKLAESYQTVKVLNVD